jgi:hypothetical protein
LPFPAIASTEQSYLPCRNWWTKAPSAFWTFRILDLVFIKKDNVGNVDVVELEDAAYDEVAAFNGLDGEIGNLFNEEDLALLAQDIPNNNSAAGGHHDYLGCTLPGSWTPAPSSNATESNGIPSINVRPSTPANAANDRGELDVHRFFAPQRAVIVEGGNALYWRDILRTGLICY